jgi:hypothetical protein
MLPDSWLEDVTPTEPSYIWQVTTYTLVQEVVYPDRRSSLCSSVFPYHGRPIFFLSKDPNHYLDWFACRKCKFHRTLYTKPHNGRFDGQ